MPLPGRRVEEIKTNYGINLDRGREVCKFTFKLKWKKTKFMVITEEGIGSNHDTLTCEDITFDSTSQFKYLGILTPGINEIRVELRFRHKAGL